jgi:hypothetical protein
VDEQTILFLPGEVTLPARWLGIMPPTPWGLAGGGGLATKVAVEGQRVYRQAIELGMPPERLVLTGRASSDQLFLARQQAVQNKAAWRTRQRLDQCCRLVLCAVPQFAEHGLLSWPDHWRELEFLFGELSAVPGSQLVLSLHPKCNPNDYRAIATQFGAVLAEEPIEKLMPLADLFVSTISSTIVAAIGCHVPAIILDMYGMNYDTYAGCGGTVTVKTRQQFSAALASITGDQQYYQQLVQANQHTAGEWIQLDGRCCQRLVSVAGAMMAGAIADHGPTRKAA